MTDSRSPSAHTDPMIDFRVRRPASLQRKTADTAAHVAQVVGSNLREIRRRQGHSLDTLATASGVSRAMLGQIETGKSVPTITVLWKVATALGVPVGQLIADPEVALFTVHRRSDVDRSTHSVQTRQLACPDGPSGYSVEEFRFPSGQGKSFTGRREGGSMSLIVASGSIEISIETEPPVKLGEGDAIQFSAGLNHSVVNSGAGLAIVYYVFGALRKGI